MFNKKYTLHVTIDKGWGMALREPKPPIVHLWVLQSRWLTTKTLKEVKVEISEQRAEDWIAALYGDKPFFRQQPGAYWSRPLPSDKAAQPAAKLLQDLVEELFNV